MTEDDIIYLGKIIAAGLLQSPCLEVGVNYVESNKKLIKEAGCRYYGVDQSAAQDADFIANFDAPTETIRPIFESVAPFGTILLLNVLEHTFDPCQVLDNVFALLKPGGICVIVTPVVWPIHDCPRDYWRINPDFYEDYCRRQSLELVPPFFEYVGRHSVSENKMSDGTYRLPAMGGSRLRRLYSRVVHRLFNTSGRDQNFPSHVAIGAVIRKK